MTGSQERVTGETVRPRLTLVNTVMTVVRQARTRNARGKAAVTAESAAAGRRLERYIKDHWPRSKGGIKKLASEIGASTETVYAWFRGESEPSVGHLRMLAKHLGATRATLLAVYDGEDAPSASDVEARLLAVEGAVSLLMQSVDSKQPRLGVRERKAGSAG